MRRKHIPSIIVLFLLIFMVGCSYFTGITIPDTPHGKYLSGRLQFNKTVTSYLNYYEMASPEDQLLAQEKIDPLLIAGETTLDAWKVALNTDVPTVEQEQELIRLKNQIISWVYVIFKERI